jgi:hypothetical protein
MAIKCERCGRSVQPDLEVLREGKVVEFYRCRCGSQAALMPDRSGPTPEVRRGRGNTLYLRLREKQMYLLDDQALEACLAGLEEEFDREAGHVVVNLEEVQYLPAEDCRRLESLRQKVEAGGFSLAIVAGCSSLRALIELDAPSLATTLADSERRAAALVAASRE